MEITPELIQKRRKFTGLWNKFLIANKYLLHHKKPLKLMKAISWSDYKELGKVDFIAAYRKAGEIIAKS